MRKPYLIIGILIAAIITLTACSKKGEDSSTLLPELVQAEAVMYEHPDSALHILQEMKMPAVSQKLQNATWALQMTQAKYKNYIDQSDSLINIAHDYFMKHEDKRRKALVLYLKGAICNENESEKAQKLFLEAAENAEKTNDIRLCHLIYSHLGNIYVFRSISEYALTVFNKTYQYALELEDPESITSSLIFLGRVNIKQQEYDRAIECYKKAIETAESIHDKDKIMHASNELAGVYLRKKEFASALRYIRKAIKLDYKKKMQGQLFLVFGKIYTETGKTDSAYHYLNNLLSFETYIRTTTDAYQSLYKLSKKEEKYKEAVFYADQLINGLDSIHSLDKSRDLAEMQEKYNQQKVINEKNQLKIEKEENTRNALISLALLLGAIATLIYIYQRKLVQKERTIQKKEEEIRRNAIKISENGLLIRRNLLRMEELMTQIETNKDMQEQLGELNNAYSEIQQQNEILTKENQALQENINLYSSSLNAQSEELKKLNALAEESQRLHDREKTLCNQLVKNNKVLNNLLTNPKFIDAVQWKDIEEAINTIFDNFTGRLTKKIPSLTDYEIHLCCLIKLSMSNANIATILAIASTSVSKQKFRLKERIAQQTDVLFKSTSLDLWLWDF